MNKKNFVSFLIGFAVSSILFIIIYINTAYTAFNNLALQSIQIRTETAVDIHQGKSADVLRKTIDDIPLMRSFTKDIIHGSNRELALKSILKLEEMTVTNSK